MKVDEALTVCVSNLFVIDFAQPVVSSDSTRVREDKTANRKSDGGVFLDSPVLIRSDVSIDKLLVVDEGIFSLSDLFMLIAVENVGFGGILIADFHECLFDDILNFLNSGSISAFCIECGFNDQFYSSCHGRDVPCRNLAGGYECLCNGIFNLFRFECDNRSVSFCDAFHVWIPLFTDRNRICLT